MVDFQAAIAIAKNRSVCQHKQIDVLCQLVELVRDVSGDIIEIGAFRCGASIALAAASSVYSESKKVFAFDSFSGMPATSKFDQHIAGQFADLDYEEIQQATKEFSNLVLVPGYHEDVVPAFPHIPISVLFLDSDLYESHRVSLKHFWNDLVEGGIAIFHDVGTMDCRGVAKAVEEFFGSQVLKQLTVEGMWVVQK